MNDQRCLSPAGLRLKLVENPAKDSIGEIQRIQIRTAKRVLASPPVPHSRRMRHGQMQINDIGLAVGNCFERSLFQIPDGVRVALRVPLGYVGPGTGRGKCLLGHDAQREPNILGIRCAGGGGPAILRIFIGPVAVCGNSNQHGAVCDIPTH